MVEKAAQNDANEKAKSEADVAKENASDKLRESLGGAGFVLASDTKGASNTPKSNTDKTLEVIAQSRAGRYGLVTGEALLDLPNGLANGVKHNWDNPGEFAVKMGTAAAFGVGMNLLLPKAGAAKAIVGGVMTYFMVKDAAAPVIGAFRDVHADGTDLLTIHKAAKNMSDGLGLYAVDMVAGLPVGLAADKLTGMALEATQTGRNFNTWKENFYNGKTTTLGKLQISAEEMTKGFAEKIKGKDAKTSLEEALIQAQKDQRPMSIDDKLALIAENMNHEHGIPSSLRPDAEKALQAMLEHKRWHKKEMQGKIDLLLGDNTVIAEGGAAAKAGKADLGIPKIDVPKFEAHSGQGAPRHNGPEIPGNLGERKIEVKAPGTGAAPVEPPIDPAAKTVQQMAVSMRDTAAKVTETDMKIANFKESVQSPLEQSMRTTMPPPLDQGHWANNRNLIDLTAQITTPEHIQQAGQLLEHHRVANVQMGIPEKLPEIVDLNQYSRSVHQDMMNLFRKVGIKPEEVLRGTNSPIFLIFDSQGAGPYTIPAIKGVTDTAVVVLPREYQKMLGVHVAGVYRHELGHDLVYGDLLRFPESLRDNVLKKDVVSAAMKAKGIGDTPVEIPGHGSMPKSEFFTKLLLAEANENTADIFASSRDPNSGLSLAVLLSSLRKPADGAPKGAPGKLETRSMFGQEFASPDNPLGIEVHGIDAWRIKLSAEVLKQLSNGDAKVAAHADKLVKLADNMRRPGDNYVWASMDRKGEFVSIPIKEWDAIIPGIVKAQLETPLPALNNNSLKSVYSDMSQIFPKVDGLADKMAAAARSGEATVATFDKGAQRIEDVFSAGLSAWQKAIEANAEPGKPGYVKPDVLLERINNISSSLTAHYRGDNYLSSIPTPSQAVPNINTFSMPNVNRFAGNAVTSIGNGLTQIGSNRFVKGAAWATKNAIRPEVSGPYMGMHFAKELFDDNERAEQMLKPKGN